VSISSMATAATARRPDFAPPGLPRGTYGIASAVIAPAMPLPASPPPPPQPGTTVRVPAPPAQPGTPSRFPTPPAQPFGGRLPTPPAQPTGSAPAAASSSATSVSAALQVITTYIPTEILTLYVAVLAALRNPTTHRVSDASATTTFWVFLLVTPLTVWLVYAAKLKALGDGRRLPSRPSAWPVWEMSAATIAYTAWSLALPDSPFVDAGITSAIGGVLVLITSTLLGLAAPVFQRPLST